MLALRRGSRFWEEIRPCASRERNSADCDSLVFLPRDENERQPSVPKTNPFLGVPMSLCPS